MSKVSKSSNFLHIAYNTKYKELFSNEAVRVSQKRQMIQCRHVPDFLVTYRRKENPHPKNSPFLLHDIFSRHPHISQGADMLKCILSQTTYTAFHLDFPWQMFLPEMETCINIRKQAIKQIPQITF